MRVIAGACKGRKLKTVKGMNTRPTADRVKEAVFNVLGQKIIDAKVLDLFGGTGNIGIEALSRGAKSVIFVEKNKNALQVLKTNVTNCGFIKQVEIFGIDAFKALSILNTKGLTFNLIYLDPPYKLNIINDLLGSIINNSLLEAYGIVVVETNKTTDVPEKISNLFKVREVIYGDTKITYLQLS